MMKVIVILLLLPTAAFAQPWGGAIGHMSTPPSAPPVIPPPSGVPAPAVAANFTTKAFEADFTTASFSNPNTFVKQCNAGLPDQPTWWWIHGYDYQHQYQCSDVTVGADTGVTPNVPQVLHLTLPDSEFCPGGTPGTVTPGVCNSFGGAFQYPANYAGCASAAAPCFPNEMYWEVVWRTPNASWNQDGNAAHGAHVYANNFGLNRPPFSQTSIEMANFETNGGPGTSGGQFNFHANLNTPTFHLFNYNADPTVYHTWGLLVTSNGTDTYSLCEFIDGTPVSNPGVTGGCAVLTGQPAVLFSQHDNPIGIALDIFNNYVPSPQLELYLRRFTVYECASWATTSCGNNNGGVLVQKWP